MIPEGSCDTEKWSNDAENSDLHHRNKLPFKNVFFKYKTVILSFNYIYISVFTVYCMSDQINAALASIRGYH